MVYGFVYWHTNGKFIGHTIPNAVAEQWDSFISLCKVNEIREFTKGNKKMYLTGRVAHPLCKKDNYKNPFNLKNLSQLEPLSQTDQVWSWITAITSQGQIKILWERKNYLSAMYGCKFFTLLLATAYTDLPTVAHSKRNSSHWTFHYQAKEWENCPNFHQLYIC